MPEWLLEQGIGETRLGLFDGEKLVEARVLADGVVPAGSWIDARLKTTGRNAIAVANGQEYLLPKGSQRKTLGAAIQIEVIREPLGGLEPWKRPLARIADHEPGQDPIPDGRTVARFPGDDWDELLEEARSGLVAFVGGELRIAVTPAMTLIDIDGYLPPTELCIAGALAAARAIRRHAISGSVGIDFPGGTDKAARFEAAAAIDTGLTGPFERTAINGFGFMQIVRQRRHASMLERAMDRASFEARALLRRAAREVGAVRLAAHPAVIAELNRNPGWLDQLSRHTGGLVTLRSDALLAISAGYAEKY